MIDNIRHPLPQSGTVHRLRTSAVKASMMSDPLGKMQSGSALTFLNDETINSALSPEGPHLKQYVTSQSQYFEELKKSRTL